MDGGDVFENISQIVDDSFNNYIVRQGSVEPLFAQFCDGVRTQCGDCLSGAVWTWPGTA